MHGHLNVKLFILLCLDTFIILKVATIAFESEKMFIFESCWSHWFICGLFKGTATISGYIV